MCGGPLFREDLCRHVSHVEPAFIPGKDHVQREPGMNMPDSENRSEKVVVVYALPDAQHLVDIEFTAGMTAREAVERSGLLDQFPEIRKEPLVLGVFGNAVNAEDEVEPGARIEICRSLEVRGNPGAL